MRPRDGRNSFTHMILNKKYIRNLDLYLDSSYYGQALIFGYKIDQLSDKFLTRLGFSSPPAIGDSILPSSVGPVSRYNAEGKYIIHRDKDLEKATRQVQWHWKQWKGRDDTEEKTDIKDVNYFRYPRTLIRPPSIELTVGKTTSDQFAVLSPTIKLTQDNTKEVIHIINLFLEIFGFCEIFNESLDEMVSSPLRRLNWRILPPGQYPWPNLKKEISQIIQKTGKGKQKVLEYRIEAMNSYGPNFYAIGEGGFRGYVVFGFPQKGLFCLESMYYGNATYVFSDNWEALSKKTKAEILDEDLQKERLVHISGWEEEIHSLLAI